MRLTVECDGCGKTCNGGEFVEQYDSRDLCLKCDLESEIYSLGKNIKDKEEWLKTCHIDPLEGKKAHLTVLNQRLKALQ